MHLLVSSVNSVLQSNNLGWLGFEDNASRRALIRLLALTSVVYCDDFGFNHRVLNQIERFFSELVHLNEAETIEYCVFVYTITERGSFNEVSISVNDMHNERADLFIVSKRSCPTNFYIEVFESNSWWRWFLWCLSS